ncbi:abortive infection family protein [Paraburkholderia atlantica]
MPLWQLPVPDQKPSVSEPVQRQVERSMFEVAIELNRLRNKKGTGHGHP